MNRKVPQNSENNELAKLKVAIVHYWLVGMRGGEKVIEELCEIFPGADIFTHVAQPEKLSTIISSHQIFETYISRLPGAKKHYQKYLPFMPRALEALDLTGYDLVISSESGPAKGVITAPDTLHVCYCHSPMRYIWDQYHVYHLHAGWLTKWLMPLIAHRLRIWDQSSAARVDHIIANSHFISRRIKKSWGRSASVIHPPVDLNAFTPEALDVNDPFYLYVGELVSYKRLDLVIDAFNNGNRRLVVVGDGSDGQRLRAMAGANVTFKGRASFEVLKECYAQCQGLIFPGIEDFGIVPLEAMASGRPVVAYARGGALETIKDGVTGVFFKEQTPEALMEAIARLEREVLPNLDQDEMQKHVSHFSSERFRDEFTQKIQELLNKNTAGRP